MTKTKYLAEIRKIYSPIEAEYLTPLKAYKEGTEILCDFNPDVPPEKSLSDYSNNKLFGKYEGIRIRNIDPKFDTMDKERKYLFTFEINDEKLLLNRCADHYSTNELRDDIDTSLDEPIGKILTITSSKRDDELLKLKEYRSFNIEYSEVLEIPEDILKVLYKYIENIPLSILPITNRIYLTNNTNKKEILGPFSWRQNESGKGGYSLSPYQKTDYKVNLYDYENLISFCTNLETERYGLHTIFNNKSVDDVIKNPEGEIDCISNSALINLYFRRSGKKELTQSAINEIDENYFTEERKLRLLQYINDKNSENEQISEFEKDFIDKILLNTDVKEAIRNKIKVQSNIKDNDELETENERLKSELKNALQELENLKNSQKKLTPEQEERLKEKEELVQLKAMKNILQDDIKKLQNDKVDLETNKQKYIKDIREKFENDFPQINKNALNNQNKIITLLNEILENSSEYNNRKTSDIESLKYQDAVDEQQNVDEYEKPRDLIDDLYNRFEGNNRNYEANDIANIIICLSLGFITIFAGEPGTGKTSFVKNLVKFLGLNNQKNIEYGRKYRRYVEVPVEKGWTSKKDFLGFYNPLTKEFNSNNMDLYQGLRQLDKEVREDIYDFPYFVLLDEANLSPMEYYWSDFMKECDYWNIEKREINLSEFENLKISKNLKFIATVNLDHTTEILSPRLIDRSWIIKLPASEGLSLLSNFDYHNKDKDDYPLIKNNVFDEILKKSQSQSDNGLGNTITENFNKIKKLFEEKANIYFSPRVVKMIKQYCMAASGLKLMNENEFTALDYAIAQKALPMINGQGERFKILLEELDKITDNQMPVSDKIIKEININAEKNGMEYYQFFAR